MPPPPPSLRPRKRHATTTTVHHLRMAPLAVSPRVLRDLPPPQRRRWVIAAAATGAMLTSQAVGRSEIVADLPEAPRGAAAEAQDLDRVLFGTVDEAAAWATPAPSLVTAGARSTTMVALDPDDTAAAPSAAAEAEADTHLGALPDGPNEIARFDEIELITEGSGIELVGFHESSDPSAIALDPVGSVEAVQPDGSTAAGPVVALPTRHRPGAPTSAIDLAMTPGHEVPAVVSGEVIAVEEFSLYGSIPDLIVEIRSDADPTVVVTMMHLVDAQVEVGDQVDAGVTPVAAEARQLPFESQIDRFTAAHRGAPAPHVHVELAYG